MRFEIVGIYQQRVDNSSSFSRTRAVGSPFFFRQRTEVFHRREFHGFHNLSEHTVAEYHNGNSVFIRNVESVVHNIHAFLNAVGSVNYHMIIAVSAAFGRLEVISLRRLNSAESGAASYHINYYAGYLRATDITDTFLHKAYAGAGRTRHRSRARSARAVKHIYRSDFALRLYERSSDLEQSPTHIFGNFVLRRDRVSEERSATAADSRFGNRLVTFHQFFHSQTSSGRKVLYLSTVITQSGHIIAQEAHPIHALISLISTTKYPFLLLVPEICNSFFGQDSTHKPQPLQLSFFIVIFAIKSP